MSVHRDMIVNLLHNLGSRREVSRYLDEFGDERHVPPVVIKVGGAIVEERLVELASAVACLGHVGVRPVVVHGAGRRSQSPSTTPGCSPDFINGHRVTTPETLKIVLQVFQRVGAQLASAIQSRGAPAMCITTGVFEASATDLNTLGRVGTISAVNTEPITSTTASGIIPVIAPVGYTTDTIPLNINADVAARKLIQNLAATKAVFLTATGGLLDEHQQIVPVVTLADDYEKLIGEPWLHGGMRLKIQEIKALLDTMPDDSSVAITSPEHLVSELFTYRGNGTLVRKGMTITTHSSLDTIDTPKLARLVSASFRRTLTPDYFTTTPITCILLAGHYAAAAILTDNGPVPYLDKFAVTREAQGLGIAGSLWKQLAIDAPAMCWRSRADNEINPWYMNRADGMHRAGEWVVFWSGIQTPSTITKAIKHALSIPPSFEDSFKAGRHDPEGERRCRLSSTKTDSLGVIGARGYVGRELIRLLDAHPVLETTIAVSRELAGQSVASEYGVASGALSFSSSYEPQKDECPEVVVLGLPNGHAREVVREIEAAGASPRVIIDLSADFRFDDLWVYAIPELHTERLSGATRIANPGCYATAIQLALAPILDHLASTPHCFGVSGYTGAGTSPSDKNDAETLATGILPYTLAAHTHEREVTRHLARDIRFAPAVAGYPRGITLTALIDLEEPRTKVELEHIYASHYQDHPLIHIDTTAMPRVQSVVHTNSAHIGGITIDPEYPTRAAVVCVLDNLLKGAASQAIQNINLALDLPPLTGLTP